MRSIIELWTANNTESPGIFLAIAICILTETHLFFNDSIWSYNMEWNSSQEKNSSANGSWRCSCEDVAAGDGRGRGRGRVSVSMLDASWSRWESPDVMLAHCMCAGWSGRTAPGSADAGTSAITGSYKSLGRVDASRREGKVYAALAEHDQVSWLWQ